MKELFKKLFIITLVVFLVSSPAFAERRPVQKAEMNTEFNTCEIPEEVYFKTGEDIVYDSSIVIPQNSLVKAKTLECQKERRWHKSGFIICQPLSYIYEDGNEFDISGRDLYLVLRRYEALDKKEAGKTVAEVTATTGASFLLPGIDIAYYFTKGAIQKNKDENRFKSGVSNAYENSIFWFWLKGKPIDLSKGDSVKIECVNREHAEKLINKIEKKHSKNNTKYYYE